MKKSLSNNGTTADSILERMVTDCLELIELLEAHERRATTTATRDALTGASACVGELLNNAQDALQALRKEK